jgi:Poly(ADP-ribose) polymerase catalytic domain
MNSEIALAVRLDPVAAEFLLSSAAAAAFSSRFATLLYPVPAPSHFLDPTTREPRVRALRAALRQLPQPTARLADPVAVAALSPPAIALVHDILCSRDAPRLRVVPHPHPSVPSDVSHVRLSVSEAGPRALFDALAGTHGTFLAFHGTPGAAWHSILRTGLRLVPDDPAEVETGRAWGDGIYMAEQFALAAGFAVPARTREQWAGDDDFCAVGAFRVVCGLNVRRHSTRDPHLPPDYVVVPDAAFVVLEEILWLRRPALASSSRTRRGSRQGRRKGSVSVVTLLLLFYALTLLLLSSWFSNGVTQLLLSARSLILGR